MPYERKIINDPVFGFINIPKGLLYDLVRHPLLQRLTRIKQLDYRPWCIPAHSIHGSSTHWGHSTL